MAQRVLAHWIPRPDMQGTARTMRTQRCGLLAARVRRPCLRIASRIVCCMVWMTTLTSRTSHTAIPSGWQKAVRSCYQSPMPWLSPPGAAVPRHPPGSYHTCHGCRTIASTGYSCRIGSTNPQAESWRRGDFGTGRAARSNSHANACCGSRTACNANRPSEKVAMASGSPHPPPRSPHATWHRGHQGRHGASAAA